MIALLRPLAALACITALAGPADAQRFLDAVSRVGNLLRPRRHLLAAAAYCATMHERVAT